MYKHFITKFRENSKEKISWNFHINDFLLGVLYAPGCLSIVIQTNWLSGIAGSSPKNNRKIVFVYIYEHYVYHIVSQNILVGRVTVDQVILKLKWYKLVHRYFRSCWMLPEPDSKKFSRISPETAVRGDKKNSKIWQI